MITYTNGKRPRTPFINYASVFKQLQDTVAEVDKVEVSQVSVVVYLSEVRVIVKFLHKFFISFCNFNIFYCGSND